jgi:hypothetical protein
LSEASKSRYEAIDPVTAKQDGASVLDVVYPAARLTARFEKGALQSITAASPKPIPTLRMTSWPSALPYSLAGCCERGSQLWSMGATRLQSSGLDRVAASLQATPMQVALAWLLQRSPNTLLIPGTPSIGHLTENLAAAGMELPSDAIAQLDGIAESRSGTSHTTH